MSYYFNPVINGNNTALRKKRGQTKFSYLIDKKGKIIKFLGWNQKDVWN